MLVCLCFLLPTGVGSPAFLQGRKKLFQNPEDWEASDGLEWDSTWGAGLQPGEFFDAGLPLPALVNLVTSRPDIVPPKGKVLIPGCGRGYAVEALSGQNRHVVGMDIAPIAVAAANEYLTKRNITGTWKVIADRFFDFSSRKRNQGSFDLIYDYTFLSIIPPQWRTHWARRVSALLTPGGVALIAVFPIGSWTGGPPWTMTVNSVGKMLERNGLERIFEKELLADEEVHKGREGKTAIAAWRKPPLNNAQKEL